MRSWRETGEERKEMGKKGHDGKSLEGLTGAGRHKEMMGEDWKSVGKVTGAEKRQKMKKGIGKEG